MAVERQARLKPKKQVCLRCWYHDYLGVDQKGALERLWDRNEMYCPEQAPSALKGMGIGPDCFVPEDCNYWMEHCL